MSELGTRIVSSLALVLVALGALWLGGWAFAALVALLGALTLVEWVALSRRLGWGSAGDAVGIVYAFSPALALAALRADSLGLALWTLVIVWATDIGAYAVGRLIGGPRVAPAISPGKTWAGVVGGVVTAAATGAVLAHVFALPTLCFWLGAPLSLLAQAGDFFESWMKRRAGVKDSGTLIPGHGGVLDRLDGMVPVASLVGLLYAAGWIA